MNPLEALQVPVDPLGCVDGGAFVDDADRTAPAARFDDADHRQFRLIGADEAHWGILCGIGSHSVEIHREQIGLDAFEQRGELRQRAAPVVEIEDDAHVRQPIAAQALDNRDLMILLLKPGLAVIVEPHFATKRRRIFRDRPDARRFGFDSLGIVRHRDSA